MLLEEGQIGPDGCVALRRHPHGQVGHQGGVLGCVHLYQTVNGVLLGWPLASILALLEFFLDGFMGALDLIGLTLQLILEHLLLLELIHQLVLLLFNLSGHSIFFD